MPSLLSFASASTLFESVLSSTERSLYFVAGLNGLRSLKGHSPRRVVVKKAVLWRIIIIVIFVIFFVITTINADGVKNEGLRRCATC
jgi:hypothetical protein